MSDSTDQIEKPAKSDAASRQRSTLSWRWSKTLVNFWVDCLLAVVFLVLVWVSALLWFVFPVEPTGANVTLWGGGVRDWQAIQFAVLCLFSLGILLHVMLHWTWICGVVMKQFLGRPPVRDDGVQTVIGVGLIVAILHIMGGALLFAWYCLKRGDGSTIG